MPFLMCDAGADGPLVHTGRLARGGVIMLKGRELGVAWPELALLQLDLSRHLRLHIERGSETDSLSEDEREQRTLRWMVMEGPALVDVTELRSTLLPGGEIYQLVNRVASGYRQAWSGLLLVGSLTLRAAEAHAEIGRHLDRARSDGANPPWRVSKALHASELFPFPDDVEGLSADTPDNELALLAQEFDQEVLGVASVDLVGTLDVLRRLRIDLRMRRAQQRALAELFAPAAV